jgi:hypothetical protein
MSASNLEKLRLTLNPSGDTRSYDIYPIQSVDISSTKEAFSIAPPGLSARENILLGISGMNADITITAQVWEDPAGTDRANGTAPAPIVTTEDQNTYLEDTIHAPDFGAAWELDHLTGAAFNDDDVFLEELTLNPIDQATPKWDEVTFRLRRGRSIG